MYNISFEKKDGMIIANPRGNININNINHLESSFNSIIANEPSFIAINCVELASIDSSAVASLVKILGKAMAKNIKLVFYDINPTIMKTFEIMKLDKFFTILTKEKFEEEIKYLSTQKKI